MASQKTLFENARDFLTDNAVGGSVGVATDLIQNGSAYGNAARIAEIEKLKGPAAATGGAFSLLGLIGGAAQMYQGAEEIRDGDAVNGGLDMAAGTGSASSGFAGLVGTGVNYGLLPQAWVGAEGALGLTATVGSASALATTGAVGAGAAAGITLGQRGNAWAAEHEVLGKNVDGSNRTVSDWAADQGTAAQDWATERGWGDTAAFATGAAATVGASGLSWLGTAGMGAASLMEDGSDLAGDAWDAVFG